MGELKGIAELERASAGNIVPVYREMPSSANALEFFMKISDYGRKKDCILLESTDIVTKYGEKSIGSAEPCLKVKGRGERFEVIALNALGEKFLAHLKPKLGFCSALKVSRGKISGKIRAEKNFLSESERLKTVTHADVLRAVAFMLKPAYRPFTVYAGLFGAIAYDFIDQFEKLPKNKKDVLKEPDYEMNFYDNLFIVDHKKNEIVFVANALIFGENDKAGEGERCRKIIEGFEKALSAEIPSARKPEGGKLKIATDTTKKEFMKIVSSLKKNVLVGDVFQVVPSRTIISTFTSEHLDIYRALRELNPSPYMFYFRNSSGILLGSSPEMFLKVEGNGDKRVEIRPIAGTKPRGIIGGKIDAELDSRFEAELKNDRKELAEHTMLIDLARNDVARVCVPGSRKCDKPYMIEKYSHVQHLVSSVSGTLKNDLDALHAYLASMNMGTLTGAPKVEAMKLIRLKEKTRRGFYGGSIGYLTPSGDFDSAIVIRSMSLQGGKAFIRAGAGIVYDSVPENEFLETEKKAAAALKAIEIAEKGFSGRALKAVNANAGNGNAADNKGDG
ncbi:MAG TPA: anthranilate synthase component 1 [archaeon]|nr:anthranilate synthase component 1 [archaeon]